MQDNTPIPKRLAQARKAKQLSQKKLGIEAGIDEFSASARMNQYETGKHTPNFSTLRRIAKVLNVPTAYFYTEKDDIAELLIIYSQAPENKQNEFLCIIKSIHTTDS